MRLLLRIVGLVLLGILLLCGAINICMVGFSRRYIRMPENAEKGDVILELGASVLENAYPSDMLADRLQTAADLYEAGAAKEMVMSGDHRVDDYNEVAVMVRCAVEAGVPAEAIHEDHLGISTYDSMHRLADILAGKRVIIVTQRYHLYRAVYIARKLGMDAYGVSADRRVYKSAVYNQLREFLARVKDYVAVIRRPVSADFRW